MSNTITTFTNTLGYLRVVMMDDEPWFVAKDVCDALGLKNVSQALSYLDEDEKNTLRINDGNRGNPNMAIISESGLYSLIGSSRKPEAKPFKRWVNHEVLPSIRKTGGYIAVAPEETPEQIMAKAVLVAQSTIEKQKARLESLEHAIEEAKPKVDFVDEYVAVEKGYLTLRQASKVLEIGERKLATFLRENGIIMQKSPPEATSRYLKLKWFAQKTNKTDAGYAYSQMYITGKGMAEIAKLTYHLREVPEPNTQFIKN